MIDKIKVQGCDRGSIRQLWLKIIMHAFSEDLKNEYRSDRGRYLSTGDVAIQYLKLTDQYRRQFQLCLKTFNGSTANDFDDEFISAVKTIYEDYLVDLGQDIMTFAETNINQRKQIDLNFNGYEFPGDPITGILRGLFFKYGSEVLNEQENPGHCKIARISDSSKKSTDNFEGKLRKIGQYACIDDAITFIKLRIGLHKTYSYKILVDDLDELVRHFLINSSNNEINKVKAQKPTRELVDEAVNSYEILNKPKYLIDKNAYRVAVAKKIDNKLARFYKKFAK